jgi:hypothetical protein
MNPALRTVILASLATAVCFAQTPPQQEDAQQKGSITGSVVGAAGEPLKNAALTLNARQPPRNPSAPPAPAPQPFAASSDAQGNFTFDALNPGVYSLCSEKAGYLRTCYADASQNFNLDLASGQTLSAIAVKMTPQAVISGRVTDEYGDPYPQALVSAARWSYAGGHKQLQPARAGVITNAEGGFSIGGLEAGSYYVQAAPRQMNTSPPFIQKGQEEAFMTTYYPGVTEASSAIAVQVSTGSAMRGVEIRIRRARAYRIRGKLTNLAPGSVRLTPKDNPNGNITTQIQPDGSFDFEGLLPGVYIVSASTSPSSMARKMVTVGDADVVDLVLQLGPGAEITGTLSVDGNAPQPQQPQQQQRPYVNLNPTDGPGGVGSGDPQAPNDGTFAIHHIPPAVYRVQVQALPPGTYVKSIRFGGQDVLKAPLDLTSGSGGEMNVVLSPNAGDIGGMVRGADGAPQRALVTLWTPGLPAEGVTDFTRSIYTGLDGQFKVSGLPPGEYRIAAWEPLVDQAVALAPDFRVMFESTAASVTLDENQHANIEAALIGRDAIESAEAKLP